MTEMTPTSRIFVAGHRGLVGSAVLRRLSDLGYQNILTATRDQLDLRDQAAVNYWFRANRPEVIWRVPSPVPPAAHWLKYSLFYGRPAIF